MNKRNKIDQWLDWVFKQKMFHFCVFSCVLVSCDEFMSVRLQSSCVVNQLQVWHHRDIITKLCTVLSVHSTHIVLVVLSSKKLHSHRIHLIYVWLLKFVLTDTLTPLTSAALTHLCCHMITCTCQQHLYWCLHHHHHRSSDKWSMSQFIALSM